MTGLKAGVGRGPSAQIRVHVRLFAMQRELAGTRGLDLTLASDASIEDAWAALVARFPVLAPGRAAVRFACNGSYAPADTSLADGDEVAMIPPVSGGARPSPAGRPPADSRAARGAVRHLDPRGARPRDSRRRRMARSSASSA